MTGSTSVVIPTYNGESFLADAARSVWNQTRSARELIVVDDCSKDGTFAAAERLARESPIPMTVTRLEANSGGPARPINVGTRAATGDLVAVLDQDDVFTPDRIEWHEAAFAACRGADTVFGEFARLHAPTERTLGPYDGPALLAQSVAVASVDGVRLIPGLALLRLLLMRNNFICGFPGFTFRRSAWEALGGVDESLRIAGDYDFLCKLARRADLGYVTAPAFLRRDHGENATGNRCLTNLECARVRERYLRLHPELCRDPEVRAELRTWFAGFAYWLREAGWPRTATRLYTTTLRLFGWNFMVAYGLAKVWPVWVAHQLLRTSPQRVRMTAERSQPVTPPT